MKNISKFLDLTGASVHSETPVAGEITVANSSTNFAGSLAQDVQGYLAGLPPLDNEALLDSLFPALETNDFFQFAKADDEFFITEADDSDIRALGASFKRVQFRGTMVTDSTQQKGLTMRVDHKSLPKINGSIVPGWENNYAAHLKGRLITAEIIRGVGVVDAAATNAAKVWNATTNPDGDLREMAQALRTACGLMPTHVTIGNLANQMRIDAYEAPARVNHAMANHGDYTMAELAAYLGVKEVILVDAVKQAKKGAAKADVVSNLAYAYSATKSPLIGDPSNIKRAWSRTKSGSQWSVAIQEGAVYTDITVWQETKIFAPIVTGVQKRTVSNA